VNILVTGGSGFIASHLIPELLGKHFNVRATYHGPSACNGPAQWLSCDLTDAACDMDPILESIDTVIHLASLAHAINDTNNEAGYQKLNVVATERLLTACQSAHVTRFIYLSSIKVLGDGGFSPEDSVYTDNTAPRPMDIYGQTKLQAEQLVQSMCRDADIDYVILRPPLVYGPGVKANFLKLLSIIRSNWPLPLSSIKNQRSLIYVKNLCDIIIRCIEFDGKLNDIFMISDCAVSTPEMVDEIARQMQIKPRMFSCPTGLLKLLAAAAGKRSFYIRLAGSLWVDSRKFQQRFHWSPQYSFSEGIRETVDWYLNSDR